MGWGVDCSCFVQGIHETGLADPFLSTNHGACSPWQQLKQGWTNWAKRLTTLPASLTCIVKPGTDTQYSHKLLATPGQDIATHQHGGTRNRAVLGQGTETTVFHQWEDTKTHLLHLCCKSSFSLSFCLSHIYTSHPLQNNPNCSS